MNTNASNSNNINISAVSTEVIISGTLGGHIWMPGGVCAKSFTVSNQEYPFGVDRSIPMLETPTLRDMVLQAIVFDEGDFQNASIADADVVFIRTRVTGNRTITTRKVMDIRAFPSVSDCVVELESEEYWRIMDAGNGSDSGTEWDDVEETEGAQEEEEDYELVTVGRDLEEEEEY